ncbi:hypothetical protein AX769_18900 [Frondihabitans sp. PAMC 28766]|uniref:DUF7064 domain-containing protein n=1 Tax=Frondihabitans sp. PAMC 28766 TaxID=1795630 RepID=UPI00078EEB9C|nr:hypothetical protein [Frondihabitans sp. PAMC 28766]AMM21839.1 hypothetical protein AX769_18900 [Frondihabitans sp. PAMC 28766]
MTKAPDAFNDALVEPGTTGLPERFFDRLMFNLHPTDSTSPSIILGAGVYPGANTVDGFLVVSDAGEQKNFRFSTELDSTDGTTVGPLSWTLDEPMTRWRLTLAPNPTGLEGDVVWTARTPAWTGSVTVENGDAPSSTFDHLFQSGTYEGVLRLDGRRITVDGWYGQRDRSRGVRTMAGGQGLHVWFQGQFDDRSIGFLLVEGRDGSRLLLEGAVMATDGSLDGVTAVTHDLRFDDGLDLVGGRILVTTRSGVEYDVAIDASARGGYMAGAGYGGQHGKPRGLDHEEYDVYPLDGSVTPRTVDTALTDRLSLLEWDGRRGIGIVEFAHSRSASYLYVPSLTTNQGDHP